MILQYKLCLKLAYVFQGLVLKKLKEKYFMILCVQNGSVCTMISFCSTFMYY
jgi:hypothetical protein